MNITLYKATELARLDSHIDLETGEVDIAGFEAGQIALADKQRAYVAYIKNNHVTRAGLKAMRDACNDDFDKKIAAIDRAEESLKRTLQENMKATSTSEIKAIDDSFKALLRLDRDESTEISGDFVMTRKFLSLDSGVIANMVKESSKAKDAESFESGYYFAMCQTSKPSKKLVNAAIKKGEPVLGAWIKLSDRLEIK